MANVTQEELAGCGVLRNLSEGELAAFVESFVVREVEKDTVVCTQGSEGNEAYIVVSGELGVRYRVVDGPDERLPFTPILARSGAGELVGEFALLDGRPRSAELVALRASRLLVIGRDGFDAFVEANPGIGLRIFRNLSTELVGRIRETDRKLAAAMEWGWTVSGFDKL